MAQDTLLGFPAHTLPYRRGEFTTLSTVSPRQPQCGCRDSLYFQQGLLNSSRQCSASSAAVRSIPNRALLMQMS